MKYVRFGRGKVWHIVDEQTGLGTAYCGRSVEGQQLIPYLQPIAKICSWCKDTRRSRQAGSR